MTEIAIRNPVVSTAHPPSNQELNQTFWCEPYEGAADGGQHPADGVRLDAPVNYVHLSSFLVQGSPPDQCGERDVRVMNRCFPFVPPSRLPGVCIWVELSWYR